MKTDFKQKWLLYFSGKFEFNAKNYEKFGLSQEEITEIKEAFDLFDTDKSGNIDKFELKEALSNLGIDNKDPTINTMLKELDKDKSGNVGFIEFLEMMTAKMYEKDNKEDLYYVFRLFLGDDKTEKISVKHLQKVANDLQEKMTLDEINEMISRADIDKDGSVDFEEFYAIMTKKI